MELDLKMDFETENHVSAYNNPALENYECEGQMDIFDVFSDLLGERPGAKEEEYEQ